MRRLSFVCLLVLSTSLQCAQFIGSECDIPGVCTGANDDGGDAPLGDGKIDAPPGCDLAKDPKDSPACIDESVGVFVSPTGSDSGPGTKSMPVKTLTTALTKLGPKPRVYICEGAYTDSATITTPVSVYGALKCDWSIGGAKPKITGTKSDFVVKIDSVAGTVQLVDVELYGKDGTMPGESSIALFANASTDVKLIRSAATAGSGVDGADGKLIAFDFSTYTAAFLKGKDTANNSGGGPNPVTCPGAATTGGGKGGDIGMVGGDGTPMSLGGKAGIIAACNAGGGGSDGTGAPAGQNGFGASISGALAAAGWTSMKGSVGVDGAPGGGGGGGYGAGGGGGAGGCGGAGGGAGAGGGGSIALASLDSKVALLNSSLTAKNAGKGGAGVAGQAGQSPGGLKGISTLACDGGKGAVGAAGGAGGGGAGGVSIGIVYKPTKPMYGADTTIMTGTKGTGGTSPAGGASNGVDGVAQAELMAP